MNRCFTVAIGLALLGACCVRPARADDSFRCGSKLVVKGMPREQVLDLCGEPTSRDQSEEAVTYRVASGDKVTEIVPIDTWTYNRGPSQFVRYLVFRKGRLDHISSGDYGY